MVTIDMSRGERFETAHLAHFEIASEPYEHGAILLAAKSSCIPGERRAIVTTC